MTRHFVWKTIEATELVEAIEEEGLSDLIPAGFGVYCWRRCFHAPSVTSNSAEACKNWILEMATLPAGRLGRSALSHCAWSEGIQVGGGGLTDTKEHTLEKLARERRKRDILVGFVESLSQFTPILYVGEGDLRRRTKDHLTGTTGLAKYVEDTLGLRWESIQFSFCSLSKSESPSEEVKAVLELLELLAQRTLAPFGTERPG